MVLDAATFSVLSSIFSDLSAAWFATAFIRVKPSVQCSAWYNMCTSIYSVIKTIDMSEPKKKSNHWENINDRAAIAFGLALIALLLTYIAFYK